MLQPAADQIPIFLHDIRRFATRGAMLLVPIAALIFLILPRTGGIMAAFLCHLPWNNGGGRKLSDRLCRKRRFFHDYGELAAVRRCRDGSQAFTQHGVNIGAGMEAAPIFAGKSSMYTIMTAMNGSRARNYGDNFIRRRTLKNGVADLVPPEEISTPGAI